jgi:tetratricopeptide (TPR) repeat protein
VESKSEPVGKWVDKESTEAEKLLNRKGVDLPWSYNKEFGDRDFRVAGLRAGGTGVVYFVEAAGQGKKKLYAAKTLTSFLKPDYLDLSPPIQKKISRAFLEETLPWLEMGQHPHIVSVHLLKNIVHPVYRRNVPFIFSEFIPGGSLRGYLRKKGCLKIEGSLILGIQICDGLLHAYDHGIEVHQDIKPENIMVYNDRLFQVTDFGANVIGTPGYMAPEQVVAFWLRRGEKIVPDPVPVDHRADQFAVGLVVLESCLGHQLSSIYHNTPRYRDQAIRYVKEGVGNLVDYSLNSALKEILQCALLSVPNDRYPDLSSFRDKLASLYESEYGEYESPDVPKDDSAEWWFNRGEAFQALGRSAPAEMPYRKALDRYIEIPGAEYEDAKCRMGLGSVFRDICRFPEAKKMYEDALEKFKQLPETEINQARCRMNLGNIHCQTGHYPEAEDACRKALSIFQRIPGSEQLQASCTSNLGIVYGMTGRYKEAEEKMEEALNIYSRIPGTEFYQAASLMDLGSVYFTINRFPEAERMYREAVKMYRSIPGTEYNQAKCLQNIGCVFNDTGRFEEAEEKLNDALKILQSIAGSEVERARCLMNKGTTYYDTERFPEAREVFEEALRIHRSVGSSPVYGKFGLPLPRDGLLSRIDVGISECLKDLPGFSRYGISSSQMHGRFCPLLLVNG